tara:strand:+ start:105 stop:347 length:243 start_codon:yes stop_codon:yes gene_type:complete
MAAKIIGTFQIDENSFPFTAIAFGRIGGQNVGVKLTQDVEKNIQDLGYNLDDAISTLQRNLIQGDLNLPDGLKKESFVDD